MAIVHVAATQFSLYWRYSWFDYPVHLLGGTCVALALFLLPVFRLRIPERFYSLIPVLGCVLVTGILWEVFEYFIGASVLEPNLFIDTVGDLGMDLAGGGIGFFVGARVRML